ncbi:MAG: thymidine phosphorylase [Elusimicrobia bacterium]|nr:thymidine phosphorylase [Elusimicrobiota bacterium]
MNMLQVIHRKRDGLKHTQEELDFVAQASANEHVPDYQLSSWLMAVRINGMDEQETFWLTEAMAKHGTQLKLSGIRKKRVDKHSTGGVGDGVSLALVPLAACAGVAVPMMSGRGLGHTGGTLDKLESIPNLKVRLTPKKISDQLDSVGAVMFGQGAGLAPADRKLYALRDATATVDSLPLIVSSILSKKAAEDLDALVMDVKSGQGAIFETPAEAEKLARLLIKTAARLKLPTVALITDMQEPLGRAVGNALEIKQAIEVLSGDGPHDYIELLLTLGGWMLTLAKKASNWEDGAEKLERILRSGEGLKKFKLIVAAQGGNARVVDLPEKYLPQSKFSVPFKASQSGFIAHWDARRIGEAARILGAGRLVMEDPIDYSAGIYLKKQKGDEVEKEEVIAWLYSNNLVKMNQEAARLKQAVTIEKRKPKASPLIIKVIR